MCFTMFKKPHENYPPPRRIQYGNDYERYLRDQDNYQRDHESFLTAKKRRRQAGTKNATLGAAALGGIGGGGGC